MKRQKLRPPVVAVTCARYGGFLSWIFMALAIRWAGGRAVRLNPSRGVLIGQYDALILGGGANLHPAEYGESLHIERDERPWLLKIKEALLYPMEFFYHLLNSPRYDEERDDFEVDCLRDAKEREIPVLGVCRGHQMLHVFFGGKLRQSTLAHYRNQPRVRTALPRKKIKLEPKSILSQITERSEMKVNALHSQCVRRLGEGLTASAWDDRGILQASESFHKAMRILSVQWHPEYLLYRPEQMAIFNWLVSEASLNREKPVKSAPTYELSDLQSAFG